MANNIDPITGLQPIEDPKKPNLKTDPITGESFTPVSSVTPTARPQLVTTQYTDNISKYQKYNVPLRQEFNWDEQRAQRQSTAEKWGHGLLKAGVTTVGAVADNTLGVLAGIGQAVVEGDATKFYDNVVGRAVDKTNNWMQENLPNYYTEAEREASAFASLGYANFWADKVANGLGYALGSIGTVYLTGGAGLATRGIQAASKGLKSYRAAKAVSSGVKTEEALRRGAMAGRAKNAVQTAEIGMMMSYGESAVEARDVLNRTSERLMKERAAELGITVAQLPAAEVKEIRDTAAHAANTAFGLNMAVLSATNLVTFGKMLLPKYTAMRPAVKGITRSAKGEKFIDTWSTSPLWKTTSQRYLKDPLVSGLSETFQEGTQYVIQEAADSISTKGKGSISDWTEALLEGYGDVYKTKEGQESMMLGFIVGGLMGGAGSFRQRLNKSKEDKQRKLIVDALNSDSFLGTIDNAQSAMRALEASQKMQEALEAGDHKAYRDAQFELIKSQVEFHESRGSLDMFLEKIDDAANLSDQEFAQAFGIPADVKFDKAEIISGVKSKIKDYQTLKETIDAQFPTRPKQGVDRLFMSKEEKEAEKDRIQFDEFYKKLLLDNGMNLSDSNKRITKLIEEVNELRSQAGPVAEGQELTEEDFNLVEATLPEEEQTKTKSLQEKLDEIVDKVSTTNPLFGEQIKEKVRDISRLTRTRNVARSALKELYSDPETKAKAIAKVREEQKAKEQQIIDTTIKEKIEESPTSEHISELLKTEGISDDLKAELNKEYGKRKKRETEIDNDLYSKPLEEVEAMLEKETDPFMQAVLRNNIKTRREARDVNGRNTEKTEEEKSREEKRAEQKKKREEEKAALRNQNQEAADEAETTSADTVSKGEKAEPGEKVSVVAGEFGTDASNKNIVVDENGGVTIGNDSNQPGTIDRSLSKKEGLEGKEVELRLLEPVERDGEQFQSVGVFVGNTLIGVLGKTKAAKIAPRLRAGETIKGRVAQRYFSNVTNLRDQDGNPVFTPANEALQGLEGVVGYAVYTGEQYDFGGQTGVEEAKRALNTGTRAEITGLAPGQVVLVVKLPNGEFKPIAVSTNEVGGALVSKALDLLGQGTIESIEEVRELLGITGLAEKLNAFTVSPDGLVSFPYNGEDLTLTPQEIIELRSNKTVEGKPELNEDVYNALTDAIANLKLQVNRSNLEINNTYVSPQTEKSYPNYRAYIEAEVVKVDFKVIDGSIFFDVGVIIELDGQAKEQVIESMSFDEETTPKTDSTAQQENNGKEASGKFGDALLRLDGETESPVNLEKAKAWLVERFGQDVGIVIFDNLQKVGDSIVHGYMENGAIHLYKNAEVGTEYHEAFHLFFRGLLTDEQRQSLYEDAVAIYGEPTKDDIENARRGKPELSNKEARLLAIEEKLAEEFRTYTITEQAPKTLGQRIAKFFKDLFAYIKALSTDRVSVRQAFRLLEGNRIPKSFSRNMQSMSPGKAYMLREYVQTPRLHKEKVDLILYNTLNLLDSGSFEVEELLGDVVDKQSMLADWFLRHAVSKEVGTPLTTEEFNRFKQVYDSAKDASEVVAVMKELGIRVSPPNTNSMGNPLPGKTAGSRQNGLRFLAIYDNWFDQESELGGLPVRGFRSEVIERLRTEFGYKVTDETVVDTESEFERIFGISRMQEEPAKKLSQKAKRALSRIPVEDLTDSFFGFQTYIPITDVFNEVAGVVADSSSFQEMLSNLNEQKNSINSLNAVYDFIVKLQAEEQALLYSTLSLGMNAHRTLIINETEDGAETMLFSPVRSTIKKYFTNKWKNAAVGGNGVYTIVTDDKGNFKGLSIDKSVAEEVQAKSKIVFDGIQAPGNAELEAFSDALWAMGITLGKSREESRDRVREVFSLDGRYKENLEAFINETQLKQMMTEMFSPNKELYTNIFESESRTIGLIADMVLSKFETPKAASFLGGTGNMIYALNLKSDLTITKEMIANGEYGEMYLNAIGHSTKRVDSLGTILLNNLNYQEVFEPVDLDVSKVLSDERDDVREYSKMTYEDALIVALNMAFPAKGNLRYIALDTQGDRDRLTFIPVPKWENRKVRGLFDLNQGLESGNEAGSIIRNYILLDLHRMGRELTMEDRSELMTYHTEERFRAFQVGGELSKDQNQIAIDAMAYMDNPNTPMPEELAAFLDDKVREVEENIKQYYDDIVEKVGGESNLANLVKDRVDHRSYIKGQELDLVRKFVTHDMIGRLISREIFRGGVNHVKDGADYNKRSALTTTPGTILMIAGDSTQNPNYGMSPTFNEITLKDVFTSLDKKQLKNLRKVLTKQVGGEEAGNIIKAYTRSNSTDAQAFISPSMYRNIRMGMGLWSKEDQAVYEEYQDTGVWNGSIMPLKPSYEFRVKHQDRVIPISHKNSYMVLTRELAEGNAALTTLLDRMEAVGEFEGLAPVDVVNMESAKKTGGFAPIDGQSTEALKAAPVMTLDSRGLKFPQIIPEKSSYKMTFGRQPRKNMVANLDRSDKKTYTIDGVKVSGNELFDMYQAAIVEKLTKNKNNVFKRVGYDKVIEATTPEQRLKALEDLLPKLQELMVELGVERDYPQNILDALEIVRDADGNLSTAVPLAFPSVQSKLEQLLFGMFRREIYQQKMLGMEMVQFSEFGGAEQVEDLKFYNIEGGEVVAAEVDIRYDVLERMGIDPNTPREQIDEKLMTLIGYRIPQQGKSSTIVLKVRNILPPSHKASVRVPGAITTMMGSDFDIDKLYVLFPEATRKGRSVQKVDVDYNALKDAEAVKGLSMQQLNNVIFDTLVAVATNPVHLSESIAPLDIKDIEAARDAIGKSKENIDINNPSTRIQTGVDNMLSGILRGLYANGVAGRNVVTASKIVFKEEGVTIDGKNLSSIVEYSPFSKRPTDYYLSQYLSAAVDSVKDPIQAAINDNAVTAPLTIYMMSIGMTPTQAVAFLNIPAVKAQVDNAIKTGESLRTVLNKVTADNSLQLNTQEMLDIISGEQPKYNQSSYIKLLRHMVDKATKLDNLYRAVSPDAIDKAGTIPQHLDKLDKKEASEGRNASYGGVDALSMITDGDAYITAKAYYNIIGESLKLAGDLGFISNQEGVKALKRNIKIASGRTTLTEAMHRDINRAILHHLVTMPGSPIYESDLLLETKVMYNHMEGGLETLLNQMKDIVGGESNIVLEALELETTQTEKGEFTKYILNSDKVNTTLQKNYFTATLRGMMDNPSLYGAENKAVVEKFVEAVVSNSIVTSGFAPSPKSTFELIPVDFFKRLQVGAHLNNQIKNLNEDSNLLSSFYMSFLVNYGHHKFGGEFIFRKPYRGKLSQTITLPTRTENYIVASKKDKKTGVISTALYEKSDQDGVYTRIQTKGQQRVLYEANLKRENGEPVSRESSLINKNISGGTGLRADRIEAQQQKLLVPKEKLTTIGDPEQEYSIIRSENKISVGSFYYVPVGKSLKIIDYKVIGISDEGVLVRNEQTKKEKLFTEEDFRNTFNVPKDAGFSISGEYGLAEVYRAGSLQDGRPMYTLDINLYRDTDKGKGLGKDIYKAALKEISKSNGVLTSGSVVSGNKIWDSFSRDGVVEKGIDRDGNTIYFIDSSRNKSQQPNKSKLSLEQRETPTGASEKIARLRENFAAAGIDVTVVEAELPPGEKGQVIGDLIVLDPNQMDADTVYHEFGHILVDMLPQDEVDQYIAQVEKLNPELAEMVKNNYPELTGRELGKEILVTAIGLEGAKITRKSPSKIQRIINKILRSIGKLFGIQPNAAAVLAEQMFAGEIRAEYLSGEFNPKVQKSKNLQDNINKTFEEVSVSLKRQLIRLQNLPETEKTRSRIREIKTLQKNLTKIEDNMSDINQFLNFQQYVVGRVDTLELLMDKMYAKKDKKLSRQEALDLLRTVGEIRETIDSLYNTEKSKSTVHKMKKVLRDLPFGGATTLEVAELKYDLQDSLDRLEDLEQDYQDIILPLVADTLLTYGNTDINDSIDKEIERVRREKDISGFRRFSFFNKDPQYLALKKKKNEMSPEEYRDAMVDVKVNFLKGQRLGRDQIIAELRDAHTSKKKFSMFLDPMVYSNEANLQLFALSIKDAINNANEKSRGFLYQLEKQYSKFKEWKGGDFNEAEFNEDLLTTITVTRGDGSTMKLLSLVQEYDVEKFYNNRDAEIKRLNKKYKKPEDFSKLAEWNKSEDGKNHRLELSKWYKDNTVAAPKAKERLAELRQRINTINQEIEGLSESDIDRRNILASEASDIASKIRSSYRGGVFMGDLAVPNPKTYKSAKYEKIQNTPELKAYYDFVVKSYQASQKKIGKSELFINSWDKYSYIMPSVRKDRLAFVQQEGWRELIKENVQDLKRLDTDTQFGVMTSADGGRIQSIPRFYTNMVEEQNVSRDIASSIAQFTHMANTFEEKSNVVGLVEAMMTLHENRQTLAIDSNTGLPLIDEISRRVTKRDNSYVLKPGVENQAYQHLKEFVDSVFYGQFDIDNTGPLGVSLSKVAGKAAAFTATANLAFNTLQIGNQFILDNLMGSEEAVAGQFYGKTDFAWAAKTYAAEKGALGDVGKFVPRSKLGQAMQMFDALNEVSDTIGEKLTGNKLKKAIQSDPFFALQHAVEHQSTGVRMLALMHATKVTDENNKPILNEDGSEANLWDMLVEDQNGKLILDPRVKNVDKNAFIAKLHGINKRANQVKGSFDRSMGSRRAIGKLLLLFRNYFIPGLRKRFGHGEPYHVDYELGDITRGMYLTVSNYFADIVEGKGIVSSYQMMGETDKQNFKRAMYEAAAAMSTAVIFGVLNSMIDADDDDEDSYALVYAAYQARRLQTELLQFVSPGEFFHLAKSPMATVNWVGKYIDLIDQVTVKEPGYALGLVDEEDIFYQRRTGTAEKGDRKVFNKVKKVLPVLNGWQTSFVTDTGGEAIKEKIRWFTQ